MLNLGFPGGSIWKIHLPMREMQGTWVWSLGWEGLLEEEMAIHPSILDWRIPRMEEPGGLSSMGLLGVQHDWILTHTDPLQAVSVIIPSEIRTTIITISNPKKAPLRQLFFVWCFQMLRYSTFLTMLAFYKFINFIKIMPICILIYLYRN